MDHTTDVEERRVTDPANGRGQEPVFRDDQLRLCEPSFVAPSFALAADACNQSADRGSAQSGRDAGMILQGLWNR